MNTTVSATPTQTHDTPRQVLERFYAAERKYMQAAAGAGGAAGGEASFEEFAATLALDVVLHQSPDLPWGGEYVGRKRYEDWSRAMGAVFDQVDMQDVEFFEQGEKVVIVGRLVTRERATGKIMARPMAQVVPCGTAGSPTSGPSTGTCPTTRPPRGAGAR